MNTGLIVLLLCASLGSWLLIEWFLDQILKEEFSFGSLLSVLFVAFLFALIPCCIANVFMVLEFKHWTFDYIYAGVFIILCYVLYKRIESKCLESGT